MKKSQYIYLIIFFVLFAAPAFCAGPPLPPDPTVCWPPPCVPIDGGISLLIVAGAAYGGKKIYDFRKKK
jgi:hypothetical protein